MNIFFSELKAFSKANWWVFIIFFICIWIIYKTNTWNIFEISIIFFLHFLWDLFVMMMWDYLKNAEKKKWAFYQILSSIIFNIIWFYAFIFNAKPNYLISNIMFFLVSLKHYFLDIKWKDIRFLNYKLSIIVWCFVLGVFYKLNFIANFWQLLQVLSFILFAIFLILDNQRVKYFWSLVSIWLMVLAWAWETYNSFLLSNVKWVDISYTLLPLTVFVFYLKNLKSYL